MKTPWELLKESKTKIKTTWRIAFVSALVLGLLIHLPVMLSDIPNHDGLSSMYFDQNMITSGRWFLTVACGFSSDFTIPWVIGLIGLIWLALTAAVLTEVLELTDLPKRQNRTTRLRITAVPLSDREISLQIRDLGFGEIVASSNQTWEHVLKV